MEQLQYRAHGNKRYQRTVTSTIMRAAEGWVCPADAGYNVEPQNWYDVSNNAGDGEIKSWDALIVKPATYAKKDRKLSVFETLA